MQFIHKLPFVMRYLGLIISIGIVLRERFDAYFYTKVHNGHILCGLPMLGALIAAIIALTFFSLISSVVCFVLSIKIKFSFFNELKKYLFVAFKFLATYFVIFLIFNYMPS